MLTWDLTIQTKYLSIPRKELNIGYLLTPLVKTYLNRPKEDYEKALKDGGYNVKLQYKEIRERTNTQKRKNRPRRILWLNPPYNMEVDNNVGREFFKLL